MKNPAWRPLQELDDGDFPHIGGGCQDVKEASEAPVTDLSEFKTDSSQAVNNEGWEGH